MSAVEQHRFGATIEHRFGAVCRTASEPDLWRGYAPLLAFSRKTDYALVAMAELASEPGGCRSAASLAEATEAPAALLKNILKSLAQAGLLRAERGPLGGYLLGRAPEAMSVLDVVEAVEGPVALARCCGEGEKPEVDGCVHSPRCRIQHAIRMMHAGMLDVLRRTTVADLALHAGDEAGGSVTLSVGRDRPATIEGSER